MVIVIYTDERAEELTFRELDQAISFVLDMGYEAETAAIVDYHTKGSADIYDDTKLDRIFEEYFVQVVVDTAHENSLGAS